MKTYYIYPAMVIFLFLNEASAQMNSKLAGKTILSEDSPLRFEPAVEEHERYRIGELDGKDHPCYLRDTKTGDNACDGKPRTCYYHFHVEWYQSMSKACYECPFNEKDCERQDCVVANGASRPITVINRKMPGPSIEVCQNDTIIVNVTNDLMASGTTIHWHGMHQKDTPFMDGVPFVTQCPIQPESNFVYEFKAVQDGTFFWHSHIGLQRGDGLSGALIVRKPRKNDIHKRLYDFDRSEHVIQIADWSKQMSLNTFTDHYHSAGNMAPSALLINGRGRFEVKNGNKTVMTKAPIFEVTQNFRYRFRLINAEFSFCPVELSVDGHNITVIASDGFDLEPVNVKSLVSYAGERFDFIINTDKPRGSYWIKVRGLMNCANSNEVRQVAVLRYHGADNEEPVEEIKWEPRVHHSLELNTENQGEEQNLTQTISKLQASRYLLPKDDILNKVPDHKFYVAYDLHIKNNSHFNKAALYGHHQVMKVNDSYSVPTPQLNHISMRLPTSPLLVSRPSSENFCNEETESKKRNCRTGFCQCPHVLSVKLNSVVEVIIIDEGTNLDANHPFHLHGHSFRVIGQKRLGNRTTVEEVKALERDGGIVRNLKNPPIKDTVTVPDGGYTIIRFKANNPGYWLFHCHIEFHAEVGMALVFKVGEHEDMKPVPQDFPRCGNYNNKIGHN